jgi:hypothetical protein
MSTKEADQSIRKFEKSLHDTANRMQSIGTKMSIGITAPLLLFARQSLKAYDESAQAAKRLEKALGGTSTALIEQAKAIQKVTIYEDDAIISQQAWLASLGHGEKSIYHITAAAVQLAAALNIDVSEAFEYLHKTTTGVSGALGKLMPEVKAMTAEQLRSGEAIRLVGERFKGTAEEAAKLGLGPLKQLQNKFNDLQETVGEKILPQFNQLVDGATNVVDAFSDMPSAIQDTVVKFGILAAAAGPVASLSAHVLELGRAIGGLNLVKLGSIYGIMEGGNWLTKELIGAENMQAEEDKLLEMSRKAYGIGGTEKQRNAVKAKAIGMAGVHAIGMDMGKAASILAIGRGERPDRAELWKGKGNLVTDAVRQDDLFPKPDPEPIKRTKEEIIKLTSEWDRLNLEVAAFEEIVGRAFGETIDFRGFAEWRKAQENALPRGAEDILNIQPDNTTGESLFVGSRDSSAGEYMVPDSFGSEDGGFSTYEDGLQRQADMWAMLGSAVTQSIDSMGTALEKGEGFFESFAKSALAAAAQVAKAELAKMFASTVASFAAGTGGIGAVIGVGVALGLLSTVTSHLSNIQTPALAAGGMAYGPTMAMVGDNPNAHIDPEVISPLSKLKNMIGGSGGMQRVEFVLKGQDLHGSMYQTTQNNSRMLNPTLSLVR